MNHTVLMRVYTVELTRPTWPVQCVTVPVLMCEKTVWAVMGDGTRKLLGSSAFFTQASAERSRTALLQKRAKDKWLWRFMPDVARRARKALGEGGGTVH